MDFADVRIWVFVGGFLAGMVVRDLFTWFFIWTFT